MKVCRKCKSKNDLQARFCFQCGTRLSTTLAHSRLVMPDAHKVAIQTPLNLNEFIKHPLQKSADVITSQNQGKQLSPKLQEKIQKIAPSGLSKIDDTKTKPAVLNSEKVPLPLQLKRKAHSDKESITAKMRITKKTMPTEIDQNSIFKPTELEQGLNSEANTRLPSIDSHPRSSGVLNPQQKLRLSGGVASNEQTNSSVQGLRPENREFSLARLEQMESQKREKLEKENRRKQLRTDLAYLDQVFPNEASELEKRAELSANPQNLSEELEKHTNIQISKQAKPIDTLTSDLKLPIESDIVEDECSSSESSTSRSNQWINTIGKEGPASPAERLNQSARLDSGEFITPFLTIAAFVYFCYVLYI